MESIEEDNVTQRLESEEIGLLPMCLFFFFILG